MPSSYWFQEVPDEKRFPTLDGDHQVDVAIMGGGIAGICSAYHLCKAGKRVALLEMGTLAGGDSGLTTAFVTHFLDAAGSTNKVWKASSDAVGILKRIIADEKISCDWRDVATVGFTQKEDTNHIRELYEIFKGADPTIEFGNFFGRAALQKKEGEGQFHIRKFLKGVSDSAHKNGVEFFEESEVMEISLGETVTLKTPTGTMRAKQLIVAAGAPPSHLFPEVANLLSGAITYVVQASYSGGKPFAKDTLYWDDEEPFHYLRWVNETDLILGGEDRLMKGARPQGNPHEKLTAWLTATSQKVGSENIFSVVNKWQGTIFYTKDYLPYIGAHPSYGDNVIFLTGFGGNGMTFGSLSSQIAADMVQGKENPHAHLFTFKR